VKLAKWQGLGNDYLIVEEAALPVRLTSAAVAVLCDRHVGLGADGILLNCHPTGAVPGAVARMRVFNPDGSEPEMCGNGVRMFARYLQAIGTRVGEEFTVETLAGPIRPALMPDGRVRVDMGLARFRSGSIAPEASHAAGLFEGPLGEDVVDATLRSEGQEYRFTFVDVGNPHCVMQVDDPESFDVSRVGAAVEHHPLFPNRVNVQFARIEQDGSVRMRVWERGVGETRASGTGATAVGAAMVRLGCVTSPVLVRLPGGELTIEADPAAETERNLWMHMTGPAEQVYEAELSVELLRRLGWVEQSPGDGQGTDPERQDS
jgi:diaminopimelate epimerase